MVRLEAIFHQGKHGGGGRADEMRTCSRALCATERSSMWLFADGRALGFDLYCWLIFIFINNTTNITNNLCLDPVPTPR